MQEARYYFGPAGNLSRENVCAPRRPETSLSVNSAQGWSLCNDFPTTPKKLASEFPARDVGLSLQGFQIARMAATVDMKLLRATKFPPEFNQKVDMQKVNLQVMKKWVFFLSFLSFALL